MPWAIGNLFAYRMGLVLLYYRANHIDHNHSPPLTKNTKNNPMCMLQPICEISHFMKWLKILAIS